MKLLFENIDIDARPTLTAIFNVCVRELGVADNDATVLLGPLQNGRLREGGNTDSRIRAGRVISMKLAADTPPRIVTVFCHEMVHVEQIATGRLYTPWLTADDRRTYWLGELYPEDDLVRRKGLLAFARTIMGSEGNGFVPWEDEAYRRGPELVTAVMREVEAARETRI